VKLGFTDLRNGLIPDEHCNKLRKINMFAPLNCNIILIVCPKGHFDKLLTFLNKLTR
jgi:hypothetical protein